MTKQEIIMSIQIKPYKFAPVTFALNYNKSTQEISNLIIDILSNKKAIEKIHIIPNWVKSINEQGVEQLMIKNIHGTLAIEGNPSGEREIEKVLSEEEQKQITERKNIEIYNIKEVYDFINNFQTPDKNRPVIITEDLIKQLHKIITDRTFENDNVPGQYRNFEVKVGKDEYGGVYRPPHILEDIKMLMAGFTEWLNSSEVLGEYAFIRAVLAHYYLEIIHPFGDGNGRTGRAIESLILRDSGFKYGSSFALWEGYYLNYAKYFSLLSKTRKENKGDQTEFIIFALTVLDASLEKTYDNIIDIIDGLLFIDYITFLWSAGYLNERQNSIIDFIFHKKSILKKDFEKDYLIKILYRHKSQRTFARDMAFLLNKEKLITKVIVDAKEYYRPNIKGVLTELDQS